MKEKRSQMREVSSDEIKKMKQQSLQRDQKGNFSKNRTWNLEDELKKRDEQKSWDDLQKRVEVLEKQIQEIRDIFLI